MSGKQFLGEFEELVLLAIMKIGKEAYGVSIAQAIEDATGKKVSTGALYTALQRLESKGFVVSEVGEATPERGGRAKKYFRIDSQGRQAILDSHNIRMNFVKDLEFGFSL